MNKICTFGGFKTLISKTSALNIVIRILSQVLLININIDGARDSFSAVPGGTGAQLET